MRLLSEIIARSTSGKSTESDTLGPADAGAAPPSAPASMFDQDDPLPQPVRPEPALPELAPPEPAPPEPPYRFADAADEDSFDLRPPAPSEPLQAPPLPSRLDPPETSRRAMAQEAMKLLKERAVPDPQEATEGRAKTRLLGFGAGDPMGEDIFDSPAPETGAGAGPKFPVGWLVVADGPGRGASFALQDGAAQIGRGADQAISLDFGDTAISRANHAAVAYDSELNAFYLGHGGKTNIVRLNNKPVLSTEELRTGDEIRIGETTLRFVALCDDTFSWASCPSGA